MCEDACPTNGFSLLHLLQQLRTESSRVSATELPIKRRLLNTLSTTTKHTYGENDSKPELLPKVKVEEC
jgi:hypothetical protein